MTLRNRDAYAVGYLQALVAHMIDVLDNEREANYARERLAFIERVLAGEIDPNK